MGSSEDNSFPYWVAWISLGFALTLFFANTVPALRERDGLREVDQDLTQLRRSYEDAIRQRHVGAGQANEYDLQALLVAIDQLGFTPRELCAAYPMDDDTSSGPR